MTSEPSGWPSQEVVSSGAAIAKARRRALNRRLRIAFLQGAEEQSQREMGRPLTTAELRRILWRYPGDLRER